MLATVQQLLVAALREPDPLLYLQQNVPVATALSDDERKWLLAVDGDGLRLSRMLIRKLRLQRIVRGDAEASAFMAREPERFAACFARYDREEPLRHVFPHAEAEAFRRYW